jgi:hypothetical protein
MRTMTTIVALLLFTVTASAGPEDPRGRLNPDATIRFERRAPIAGHRVTFQISPGVSYSGVIDLVDEPDTGIRGWAGRLDDGDGTFAVVSEKNLLHARLRADNRVFRMTQEKGGYRIWEIDASRPLPCGTTPQQAQRARMAALSSVAAPGWCSYLDARPTDPCWNAEQAMQSDPYVPAAYCSIQPADSMVKIRALIAYTPQVSASHSIDEIKAETWLSVCETNLTFLLSQIKARLLIGERRRWIFCKRSCIEEVSYTEQNNLNLDLAALLSYTGTAPVGIYDLRDRCAADVVLLYFEGTTPSFSGMTCVMKRLSEAYGRYALGLVHFSSMAASYVFTHELGHMMGAGHHKDSYDTANSCATGMCKDSAGWHFVTADGRKLRTVMAYRLDPAEKEVLHFSDPNITYGPGGPPTGSADANNARTLRITAETVSKFRP